MKVGGERAYKLHRRGVAVEMPVRRSRVDALELVSYADGVARLDLRVSSGTYVRAIATALGGHCRSLRRTEVGPFRVEEADPERLLTAEEALAPAVKVARQVRELESKPRAVALGTFDGVHLGHRRVLDAALAAGQTPTVVTFDPHPREALGYGVELLVPLERRLELLGEAGIEETLVVDFDLELAQLEPEAFAERVLRPIGTEVVVAGANFRFGRGRAGDLALLERLGFDAAPGAARRRRLLDAASATCCGPARSTGRRSSSAGRRRWPARSSPATRAAARSASRRRTCGPSRACSSPATASTRAPRTAIAPRSRSARTRTTAATSGESRRSCSTSPATCTASG